MAANGTIDQQTLQVVAARAKTLIGTQLKEICRKESLPVSGVKGTLQQRILDRRFYFCTILSRPSALSYNYGNRC